MNKAITFFVAGGKGTQPFMNLYLKSKYDCHIVINTVDWGGHSGVIGRILERLNLKFLPTGDLRNNIANILLLNGKEEIANMLQKRVETLTDAQVEVRKLCEVTKVDDNLTLGVFEFFNIYKKGLEESIKHGEIGEIEGIKHNIGNLFFVGIAYALKNEDRKFGGFSALLSKIKEMELIPKNIFFHYLFDTRLTLSFRTKDGVIYYGEDVYDHINSQVELSTLNYIDPETKIKFFDLNKHIIKLIEESDLIIFPTGSESNCYPAIKMYAKYLKSKQIIKFVNILALPNSEGIGAEMVYLYGLGLKPKFLFPKPMDVIIKDLDPNTTNIFFRDLGIYTAVEEKRPQFYKEARIKDRLYDMAKIKLYKFHQGQQTELDNIVKDIIKNIEPVMDVLAFNSNNKSTIANSIKNKGKYDVALLDKGLRHDRNQVSKIVEDSLK